MVAAIGNTRTAFIAGPSAVAADLAGGARCAVALADRLALIVCVIFAHQRPVFRAAFLRHGLSRKFSDALAKHVWRSLAAFTFGRWTQHGRCSHLRTWIPFVCRYDKVAL